MAAAEWRWRTQRRTQTRLRRPRAPAFKLAPYVRWEELEEQVTKGDLAFVRRLRKAKLYADEDIEEEIVEYLRGEGVNIESAHELGHRGKPDEFHNAYAKKKRRFLLTKNARDFLNDGRSR